MSSLQPGQPGSLQAYPDSADPLLAAVPKPPLPATVRNAYYLMLVGAVVSLGSLAGLGSKSSMRTAVIKYSPNLTPDQVNTAVNFGYVVAVIVALLGAGLWVWMAFKNKAGRNWARITGTVFFGIDTLSLIGTASRHTASGFSLALNIAIWLIGLATVVLIWNKASSAYYRPQPAGPYPGYPGGFPEQ